MSPWTNEKHESARKWVNAEGPRDTWVEEQGDEFLADALDEIERLRALTTITDDMVERAEEALVYTMGQESDGADWISEWQGWTVVDGTYDMPNAVRTALEAALNPKEN